MHFFKYAPSEQYLVHVYLILSTLLNLQQLSCKNKKACMWMCSLCNSAFWRTPWDDQNDGGERLRCRHLAGRHELDLWRNWERWYASSRWLVWPVEGNDSTRDARFHISREPGKYTCHACATGPDSYQRTANIWLLCCSTWDSKDFRCKQLPQWPLRLVRHMLDLRFWGNDLTIVKMGSKQSKLQYVEDWQGRRPTKRCSRCYPLKLRCWKLLLQWLCDGAF